MRLTGMLNFYEEFPGRIRIAIEGLVTLGVDRLVAVDGAYALFPDGTAKSSEFTTRALIKECDKHGIELILYQPNGVWEGNEVGKRAFMLHLALQFCKFDDWLVIYDSDYRVMKVDIDLKAVLPTLKENFATASFTDQPDGTNGFFWYPIRMFMRAQRGLHMKSNHYTYYCLDGTYSEILVRGSTAFSQDLSDQVFIQHEAHTRDKKRQKRQMEYYVERDGRQIES